VLGVVGLLGVATPEAQAATTFIAATPDCYVTRLVVNSVDKCPAVATGIAGYASATAVANLTAQTFDVATAVRPDRARVGVSSARSQIDLVSGTVTSAGGPVKIVLTQVTGGTSRYCDRVCGEIGGTYGYVDLLVQLRMKNGPQSPYVLCSLQQGTLADTTTLPSTLVIPDDCESRQGRLEAPPNSTFDVVMNVFSSAEAMGTSKARARFAAHVSEIRVP
jgi:hypothetical protein